MNSEACAKEFEQAQEDEAGDWWGSEAGDCLSLDGKKRKRGMESGV